MFSRTANTGRRTFWVLWVFAICLVECWQKCYFLHEQFLCWNLFFFSNRYKVGNFAFLWDFYYVTLCLTNWWKIQTLLNNYLFIHVYWVSQSVLVVWISGVLRTEFCSSTCICAKKTSISVLSLKSILFSLNRIYIS